MEKELQNKLDIGYKRLALISTLWAISTTPFVFIIDKSYLTIYVIIWMIWVNVGVFISPKIMKLIWN